MNVQRQGKQHNSFFLLERLARRIMDLLGPDHRWKECDVTYIIAYSRVRHMKDEVLFRYVGWLMRDPVDLQEVTSFREIAVCDHCVRGFECRTDHSIGISLRDIMIFMICKEVVQEIESERFNYFSSKRSAAA